jgi:hypothetical protein
MLEVEAVDGVPGVQAREPKAALDGAAVAGFQFAIDERFQRFGEAAVFGGGVSHRLIQLAGHGGQAELVEFLMQCGHGIPFGNEE